MSEMNSQEVKEAFKYPLFEAIAHRRTRRLPLGYTIDSGMIKRHPTQTPVPLNDVETAILCWSGAGITGTALHEGTAGSNDSRPISWIGRATGNPCNTQTTRLFFTNDNGIFCYNPKAPTKPIEFETESDREKIMTYFKEECHKVSAKRLQLFTAEGIPADALNNQTGTTLFIPVVDNVELYIWRVYYSLHPRMGYQFFDDIKNRPAGLQKWINSGRLKGPPVSLSSFEYSQRTISITPAYLMVQNMHLIAETMGLGSVIFAGFTGELMLGATPNVKGLGFRIATDKEGKTNTVGLDSVFEAYCPPYHKNMDEAIDAFFENIGGLLSGIGPDYTGALPFEPGYWEKNRPKYERPDKEHIDMVKAFCNYVYDTYGRIPATYSAKTIPIWLQVHHANTEFYDKNYASEVITETHRKHMELWHPKS
jgi:hypothetical protein